MGRDKDSSARKAGGRMAASSAGAAAMVASMGAGGGLTFAAFDPDATSTEQDLDPELSLALKKLSKRDPTTKIKALSELLAFCRTEGEGGRTEEELLLVLPHWQQPFQTLALDADRRVREALFETLGALVVRVKKHMTKHLRGLMLPWLCARFDTESSVRSAANVAFSALLPPSKIADALLYCKADILHGIDTNLAHTVQTLCDPKLYSKEEADETIARVHSSSLLSFAHMLEALPVEQAVNFARELKVLPKPAFWKLSANGSVHVRAAFYTVVRALAAQAPSVLQPESEAASGDVDKDSKLKMAGASLMQGLADKDASAHTQMWECLLVFCRAFPSVLAAMDMSKAVLPRLFTLVKSGLYGSAVGTFSFLVPFAQLCVQASPQIGEKLHTGLLESLWEALSTMRAVRGGDDGARAATVRVFFECQLHAWQSVAAGGADEGQVAQRVESLTTVGLLRCIDALIAPDAHSTAPVPGGRQVLLGATVKCIDLLCSRDELAVARGVALKVLVGRLLAAASALGDCGGASATAQAKALSELLSALKRDGAGRVHMLGMMQTVGQALRAKCWEEEGEDGKVAGAVAQPQLAVLCDLVSHWGAQVLSEGAATQTRAQTRDTAARLLTNSAVPSMVWILDKMECDTALHDEECDTALHDESKTALDLLFRLASSLLVEQLDDDDKDELHLWPLVLTSVAGSSSLPSTCARVEALAMMIQHAASVQGDGGKVRGFRCQILDSMVLDASTKLLLRHGHVDEPGGLLSSKLHSLILAVLPNVSGGQDDYGFLISEFALSRLMQRLTSVMHVWALVSHPASVQDEALVEGAQVTPAVSSAAVAGIETVERVLLAWQASRLPDACKEFVTPMLGALFRMRVHSEDMIAPIAGADRAPLEQLTDRPLYDHDAQMASRMRSRTGLRACTLWEKCARTVLVDALQVEEGVGDPKSKARAWAEQSAAETGECVHKALVVSEALVLADQATEILNIARACSLDASAIFGVLLQNCCSLPQGASTTGGAGSMWLAFGLRLMHCLGLDTVVELIGREKAAVGTFAPMSWLLEEAVLAYAHGRPLEPSLGHFASANSVTCVWSRSAVCGDEEESVDGDTEMDQVAGGVSCTTDAADLSPDIALAWSKLVTPILVGDLGKDAGSRSITGIAHNLVFKGMRKTLEGCLHWPHGLLHMLRPLAQAGGTRYLQLCMEMLDFIDLKPKEAWLSGTGASLIGKARLAVILVKNVAQVVSRSDAEVAKAVVGNRLLYCNSTGHVERVELLAVHCEEFPPFYSIRMLEHKKGINNCGSLDHPEKQTEAHRLSSASWLETVTVDCGTEPGAVTEAMLEATAKQILEANYERRDAVSVTNFISAHLNEVTEAALKEANAKKAALTLSRLRVQVGVLVEQCVSCVLNTDDAIRAALGSALDEDKSTRVVASLALIALCELCRCRQHHVMGSDRWLTVLERTCKWYDPSRQSSLPSPESSYMLSASAGLVMSGHDIGAVCEATSYSIAQTLGADAGEQLDVSILSYWLAQLAAEPNGGCVRALCSRPLAWAHLAARVHAVIVTKSFWGSTAQGLAMQVLLTVEASAVALPASISGNSKPDASTPAPAVDGDAASLLARELQLQGFANYDSPSSEDEVVEVIDDEEDEDEVVEVIDDDDDDDSSDKRPAKASAVDAKHGADAQVVWERCRLSGFSHVLGEMIAVRDLTVAGLATHHISRVRLLASVAGAAPKDVLELSLIHLDRKRRQGLCEALHSLLSATDVVVQTSAYKLLSRFYTIPALLMHLDALEWEGLEPEREGADGEGDDVASSPSAASTKRVADLLRAIPAPLAKALRTSADAAGQLAAASPNKSAQLAAAEEALMSTESLGVLLAWLLVLEFRPRCSTRLQGNVSAYLRNQTLIQPLLSIASAHVVSSDVTGSPGAPLLPLAVDLEKTPDLAKLGSEEDAASTMLDLAAHILFRSVAAFPSLVRLWYNDLDRGTANRVDKFVAGCISPLILAKEVSMISGAALDDTGELTIRASSKTREITAAYSKDEAVLEVVLRVPPSYPLRPVQVDGTRRVGVSEGKWKMWALAMRTLLDNKDGSLLDAVLLWKKNVDQVFEGVEECPICYTVIHMVNNTLPKLCCHTCKNKFHSACLYKWFNTSNKSACPLCQSPWYS